MAQTKAEKAAVKAAKATARAEQAAGKEAGLAVEAERKAVDITTAKQAYEALQAYTGAISSGILKGCRAATKLYGDEKLWLFCDGATRAPYEDANGKTVKETSAGKFHARFFTNSYSTAQRMSLLGEERYSAILVAAAAGNIGTESAYEAVRRFNSKGIAKGEPIPETWTGKDGHEYTIEKLLAVGRNGSAFKAALPSLPDRIGGTDPDEHLLRCAKHDPKLPKAEGHGLRSALEVALAALARVRVTENVKAADVMVVRGVVAILSEGAQSMGLNRNEEQTEDVILTMRGKVTAVKAGKVATPAPTPEPEPTPHNGTTEEDAAKVAAEADMATEGVVA